MQTLILADFANPVAADQARQDLLGLATAYLPDVADAVIVTVDASGSFRLDQMVNVWTTQNDVLSLIRLLRWVLFVQPLPEVAVAGQSARLHDALSDFGIAPDFTKQLQQRLRPGQALLIVMSRTQTAAFVGAHLPDPLTLIETDSLFDTNLRDAFIGAISTINSHHASLRRMRV